MPDAVDRVEKVTKIELLRGLHKPEIRQKIRKCPPLIPLLKPRAFWATLMAIDTDHDGNITYDEVRGFCAGVLTAQNALVHEVEDAIKMTQGINETLKTLYDVANINMDEAIPFSKIDEALDDTFTLAEISRKSPILELQEDDDSSFESLKKALLDAKVAQDRLNHTNNLYLKGSKNVSPNEHAKNEFNADDVLVSFHEVYLYCCGLCIAQLNAKRGLERKKFPEESPDYNLNKALGTLFTMMRVSKRKDEPSRFDATSKLSIVHAMGDQVILEKLMFCRDIRVLLEPHWYWPALSALQTATHNKKISLEELRAFVSGLNSIYLQRKQRADQHHVHHSREYLDQIDGPEKDNRGLPQFIWPQDDDKYIGKSLSGKELEFYEHVAVTNSALRRTLPRFGGICYHNGERYLKLENILAGFQSPCIVDIKIGKNKDKTAFSKSSIAYEIAGMRLWDPDFHQFQDVDAEELSLERFFRLGTSQTIVRLDVLRQLIPLLKSKLKLFKSSANNVDFFGSSLLIAYDAESRVAKPRVMFIDFEEYTILRTATRLKNREDQCIEGLSSIIAVIEKAATNLVGQLLEGMLVTYRSAKAKSIDSNDSFTEATNKQLGILKSVEKIEKIQRNVSMMFSIADKND